MEGLHESNGYDYYRISDGKIRKKTEKEDPKAIKRVIEKTGDVLYERVYNAFTGKILSLWMSSHNEFGNTWNLLCEAADKQYVLQVNEDSRYSNELLKKIPNIKFGETYKITPYQIEEKGKKNIGLSLKDKDEQRVDDFYHDFKQDKSGKFTATAKYGFPEFKGDPKDKEDYKIYFIEVKKFLRNATNKWLEKNKIEVKPEIDEPIIETGTDDDLPF